MKNWLSMTSARFSFARHKSLKTLNYMQKEHRVPKETALSDGQETTPVYSNTLEKKSLEPADLLEVALLYSNFILLRTCSFTIISIYGLSFWNWTTWPEARVPRAVSHSRREMATTSINVINSLQNLNTWKFNTETGLSMILNFEIKL